MRTKGTPEELERIRMKAVNAVLSGDSQVDVARILGVYPDTVSKWVCSFRKDPESLRSKPILGRRSRLSPAQLEELIGLLRQGAIFHGWKNDIWTCPRVAEIIQRHFGVSYHPDHVFKIVTEKLNWSFQRPEKVARERNSDKVKQWLSEELPEIKKRPKKKARP